MSEGQVVENTSAAVAEPVTGQSAPASTGTLEGQNGQATPQEQSAPVEESFSSIDPKTLPPELQALHKQLQADYTKKTQSIAETRKKAEYFDKVSSRPDFKDWWGGMNRQEKAEFKEQKEEAEKRLGEKISDEDFTKAFNSKEDFLNFFERAVRDISEKSQKKIEKLEQQLSVKDAADVVESFATEVGKDGKPVRPDFYSLDEDQLITGFLNVNPPENKSQEAYVSKLNEAYGWAKGLSQKYYEKGKAEALQIIQRKAAASTEPPTAGAKGAYSGPNPKNLSVREALELAKKGVRVPRDD